MWFQNKITIEFLILARYVSIVWRDGERIHIFKNLFLWIIKWSSIIFINSDKLKEVLLLLSYEKRINNIMALLYLQCPRQVASKNPGWAVPSHWGISASRLCTSPCSHPSFQMAGQYHRQSHERIRPGHQRQRLSSCTTDRTSCSISCQQYSMAKRLFAPGSCLPMDAEAPEHHRHSVSGCSDK